MDQPEEQAPVVFIIECIGVTECRVSFEPEGWEHVLREDDLFRVEALPPAGAHVEIAYRDDGITVVWAERTFNKAGTSYSCSSTSIRVAFRPDRDTR